MQNERAYEIKSPQVRRSIRHSLRDGFNGFLRALPGDQALLSPSARTAPRLSASLGAPGPHDFAVRVRIIRPTMPTASTASRLAFVTTRPPLVLSRDGCDIIIVSEKTKEKYFGERDWTTRLTLELLVKLTPLGTHF
jgi:hypothetical protein